MVKDNNETNLEDRIRHLFKELENEPVGTDRYKDLTAELHELYGILNKVNEIHAAEVKAYESNEREIDRLKSEKRRSIGECIVNFGTTAFSVFSSIFLAKKIMKFEEEGVLTSKSWTQCVPKIRWK